MYLYLSQSDSVGDIIKEANWSLGKIPSDINHEDQNTRSNTVTGWDGQQEAYTYVAMDLGLVHKAKFIPAGEDIVVAKDTEVDKEVGIVKTVEAVIVADGFAAEGRFACKEEELDRRVVFEDRGHANAEISNPEV